MDMDTREIDQSIQDLGPSSHTKKKGRGKTVMKEYWSGSKPKVPLEWNEHGQPVGDGSTILSSYVGVVARSGLLPLCIDDWRHIDREVKTRVIEHLKKKSKENMQSQSHSKAPHNTGRKSIANRAKDLQKNHPQGVVPSRHELWKLIRARKNEEPMNEYCHQIFAAIDECVIRMEERNDGEVNGMDVLGEVLGKEHCERVREMGKNDKCPWTNGQPNLIHNIPIIHV
ncbi:hypothetical protein QJS04_geneDACA006625 [Acorus gramineus]|uniref:Uncharacterized protein n=1 Tax=Acorus gramineus TaxID=55184 RepID=A0AAV9A2N9_ACOGR|nr:hypothetical protein QJS04_geneDACA006625 [Acorus gramineus]